MTQSQNVKRDGKHPAIPPLPPWPTSIPGPRATEPPPGTRRMPVRTDQVIEIDYDTEQGKSSARNA